MFEDKWHAKNRAAQGRQGKWHLTSLSASFGGSFCTADARKLNAPLLRVLPRSSSSLAVESKTLEILYWGIIPLAQAWFHHWTKERSFWKSGTLYRFTSLAHTKYLLSEWLHLNQTTSPKHKICLVEMREIQRVRTWGQFTHWMVNARRPQEYCIINEREPVLIFSSDRSLMKMVSAKKYFSSICACGGTRIDRKGVEDGENTESRR